MVGVRYSQYYRLPRQKSVTRKDVRVLLNKSELLGLRFRESEFPNIPKVFLNENQAPQYCVIFVIKHIKS